MDNATTVAVFSFLGIVISTGIGALVSVVTNRSEKQQTAETAMERTLRERIVLRDEQIADLTQDRDYWKSRAENTHDRA